MDLEPLIQHHQSEGWNPQLHTSYWFMLMILIYWMEEKHGSCHNHC